MKMLTMRTVIEYIETQGIENVNLSVVVGDDTKYTTAQIYNEFRFNYWDYKIPLSDIFTANAGYFIQLWNEYVSNTKNNLARTVAAMEAEYNPISNYDMTEEAHDGKSYSKETDTTTPTGGSKTTVNRFGIDSGTDGAPYDVTEVTPLKDTKTDTTREFENDQSIIDNEGNAVTGMHEASAHYLKRAGNIGTTLASDMLASEISVRKHDILREYVREFVGRYMYTIGGDDQ